MSEFSKLDNLILNSKNVVNYSNHPDPYIIILNFSNLLSFNNAISKTLNLYFEMGWVSNLDYYNRFIGLICPMQIDPQEFLKALIEVLEKDGFSLKELNPSLEINKEKPNEKESAEIFKLLKLKN